MSNFSLNLRTGFLISNYLLAGLALTCLTLSEIFSVFTGGILIAGLIYCYALEYRATIPARPNSSRSPRTQPPDTNPLSPGDELATLHHSLFRQRSSRNDPILPFRWTRCYGLAEKPDFIEMERVDSESKMGFVDPTYNSWLYFSFTKMWVFAAIVASSITV